MKQERIGELFDEYDTYIELDISHFTEFINKIEKEIKLEWYKKLEKNLCSILDDNDIACDLYNYHKEIKNKIKELENEN